MRSIEALIGVANGVWGDWLSRTDNGLAVPLAFRRHGRDVPLTAAGLRQAYPDAAARIAVFVHGLCCDEQSWLLYGERDENEQPRTYGSRLHDDLGYTPVYLRYNSGRHISENGEDLARALQQLVDHWPKKLQRIALIGHSMGGLVIRSACHHGLMDDLPEKTGAPMGWTQKVTQVICLGSPHQGAPLEKIVNVANVLLGAIDITRPIATAINSRSAGIKDLRHGALRGEDWADVNPDAVLGDRRLPVMPLPRARYHYIGATLGGENHALGLLLGDGLVRGGSASGHHRDEARHVGFKEGDGHILTKLHHMQLLNHPDVYVHLETWLS
jgi:pimeloyl-ACP methyl ester carboxylesterase